MPEVVCGGENDDVELEAIDKDTETEPDVGEAADDSGTFVVLDIEVGTGAVVPGLVLLEVA